MFKKFIHSFKISYFGILLSLNENIHRPGTLVRLWIHNCGKRIERVILGNDQLETQLLYFTIRLL